MPIPFVVAKKIMIEYHYLHSLPGGTKLTFGVFLNKQILGAIIFGVGPFLGHSLVKEATPDDCLSLTRLWLSDKLPRNTASRVVAIALRSLKKYTDIKFLITYADPAVGHIGTIYQATGWIYTGFSEPTPLYDMGDGIGRHSRSLAHTLGSHSVKYLISAGANVKLIAQSAKHRYIYFLDLSWRSRLTKPVLPYPKKEKK